MSCVPPGHCASLLRRLLGRGGDAEAVQKAVRAVQVHGPEPHALRRVHVRGQVIAHVPPPGALPKLQDSASALQKPLFWNSFGTFYFKNKSEIGIGTAK